MKYWRLLLIAALFYSPVFGCNNEDDDLCNPDPCADIPHAVRDTCFDMIDEFSCLCEDDYIFEINLELCVSFSSPCETDLCSVIPYAIAGSCVEDEFGIDFTCDCVAGFVWNDYWDACDPIG
ncbi:hypothetical protein ACFL4G_10335 [Thermodesulfobacteriota bacterium]